jgi:hypothetical protein
MGLSSYQKPLESFHIEHFRGLHDVRLEGLGQINLLVGINNSGKTSVLEAISTYCSPVNLREWINVARQRDQESKLWSRVSPLDALVWLFPHHEDFDRDELYKGEICISGEGEFPITKLLASCEVVEGVNINHALYQSREDREDRINSLEEREIDEIQRDENETDEIQRGLHLNITIHRKYKLLGDFPESISKEFYLWPDERITYRTSREDEQIMNQTITPFSHRTDPYPTRLFTQATIAGFKSEVIKLLQSLDPDIEDLEILTSSSGVTSREIPVLYITHRRLGKTPLSNFGDGIRGLLFIALNLIKVQGGILLIDEIENAIHTDALQNFFLWLVRQCQEMDIPDSN